MSNPLHSYAQAIKAHAEDSYPFECCGVITESGVIACTNMSATPQKAYTIAAHELERIAKHFAILGYYHSHIDAGAKYSKTDLQQARETGKLYVIASVIRGAVKEIKAYMLTGNGFEEQP